MLVTNWVRTICSSLAGGGVTTSTVPDLLIASEIYRIFCMPERTALSKATNNPGIFVKSLLSESLLQSSRYLQFSASLFHAEHTARTHRSRAPLTSDFNLS